MVMEYELSYFQFSIRLENLQANLVDSNFIMLRVFLQFIPIIIFCGLLISQPHLIEFLNLFIPCMTKTKPSTLGRQLWKLGLGK